MYRVCSGDEGPIQYRIRRFIVRSHKFSKARDQCSNFPIALKFSRRLGILYYRGVCQISKRYKYFNTISRVRDFTKSYNKTPLNRRTTTLSSRHARTFTRLSWVVKHTIEQMPLQVKTNIMMALRRYCHGRIAEVIAINIEIPDLKLSLEIFYTDIKPGICFGPWKYMFWPIKSFYIDGFSARLQSCDKPPI